MFKTHLIQKGEVRIPPSRPEPRPAGIRPAEEGDKKSKVNKNVDKGSPEMVADHFRHHPEDRAKFLYTTARLYKSKGERKCALIKNRCSY